MLDYTVTLCVRFAAEAVSMRLVLEACGHYWASCQSLVDHSLERALLREPLTELLQLVAALGESQRRQSKILKVTWMVVFNVYMYVMYTPCMCNSNCTVVYCLCHVQPMYV